MLKVLITGANGFIANYLSEFAPPNISTYLTSRNPNNYLSSSNTLVSNLRDYLILEKYVLENEIDTIIHCAGDANVDSVEQDPIRGIESNLLTTLNLVNLSKKYNIFLVFLSSNAIFDGTKPLYDEKSVPNTINKYGLIKLNCEEIIKENLSEFCIVRPILTYGWNINHTRSNPVTFVINNLKQGIKIRMVTDVYENPLYVRQLVDVLWDAVLKRFKGIVHVAGSTILSRYELAIEVANVFSLDKNLIEKSNSLEFVHLAPRPLNTSFNTEKMLSVFKIKSLAISDGLIQMRNNHLNDDL